MPGDLTLGNASNDFTGNVTIQSGVVDFNGDGAFGNAANDIIIEGIGVPEPSTVSLVALVAGVAIMRRCRRRR